MTTQKSTINLPFSEEGERTILSCILMDGQAALAKAIDAKLSEDSFYDPTYRKVWRAIQWQHKNNKPLELYALAEELKKNGKLEEIGGYPALVDATQASNTTLEYGYWLEKVKHLQVMRDVYASCTKMSEKVLARSGSVDDFVAEMNGILSSHHATKSQKTVEEAADEAIALVERVERGEFTEKDMGLSFPWPDWDKRFGLAKPGELIIISARPGMGKSSCMRQIADRWSELGKVLIFSREMTVEQMTPLVAQTNAEVSFKSILKGHSTMEEMTRFKAELVRIKGRKTIDVYDRDRTLSHIVTRAKAFAQINKPKAIFVDYLQRYDAQQERGETRDVALGRFTMAMKDLAIELAIPVVLLAQLGRSVEKENREPRMSDLRESGNLEQDADRIIFLNAPDHKPDGSMQQITDNDVRFIYVDAIQAKGRSDGTGRCGMMFDRPLTKFNSYIAT
jgi:replicative DNA helicase